MGWEKAVQYSTAHKCTLPQMETDRKQKVFCSIKYENPKVKASTKHHDIVENYKIKLKMHECECKNQLPGSFQFPGRGPRQMILGGGAVHGGRLWTDGREHTLLQCVCSYGEYVSDAPTHGVGMVIALEGCDEFFKIMHTIVQMKMKQLVFQVLNMYTLASDKRCALSTNYAPLRHTELETNLMLTIFVLPSWGSNWGTKFNKKVK